MLDNRNTLQNSGDFDYQVFNYYNNILNDRSNTQVNLDYTNPISDKEKIELGVEYRTDETDNTNLTNQQILHV